MELKGLPLLFIKQFYHPIGESNFGDMNLRRVGVLHAQKVYAGGLLDHICTVGIKTKIHHHLLGAHRLEGFVLFFDKVIGQGLSSTVSRKLKQRVNRSARTQHRHLFVIRSVFDNPTLVGIPN